MKSSWRTAWQGQDIVIFRNEAEVDRLHAPDIERVVLVHRGSGDSPGDLVQAVDLDLVAQDHDVLPLPGGTPRRLHCVASLVFVPIDFVGRQR